jgi:hypothetical protein
MVFMVGLVLFFQYYSLPFFTQIYYNNQILYRNCCFGLMASCDITPPVHVGHRMLCCSVEHALCNDWLYAWNVMPCVRCEHVAGCPVIGGWAKHVTVVRQQVTACVLSVSSWYSHVEGPLLTTVLLWFLELMWGVPLVSGYTRGPLLTTVGSFHTIFCIYFCICR